MITTKDIKIKDQEPKKLTIISTGDVNPKEFVVKGKGKKKLEQIITTGNIEDEKTPLTANQKKIVADIKASRKEVADLIKKNKELQAKLEKKDKEKLTIDKQGKANKEFAEGEAVYQKEKMEKVKGKPWKEMTDAEKEIEMKRRVAKGKATKAEKAK